MCNKKKNPEAAETLCYPGAKVEKIKDQLKFITDRYNVNKMIIHVGGNNIPNDNIEQITGKIIDLLRFAKCIMPNTTIYFSHILPRMSNEHLNGINTINARITQFAVTNNFKIIPHNDFQLQSGINVQLMNQRGLVHPNFKGTLTFAKNLIASYRNYRK